MPKQATVLCVGDTHFPFARRKSISAVIALAKLLKPNVIVQLGDLYDMYSYSRFARSYNLLTPAQEIKKGRQQASEFWREIRAASPKADCYGLIGNHDSRVLKKAMGLLPELEHFLDGISNFWQFDGVTTQGCERDELILDGVCYMHGFRKFGDHMRHNLMNTVCGHSHTGGVAYMRLGPRIIWELNAGFVADPDSVPMSYGPQLRFSRQTQGCGWIDQYGPRFIPIG